MTELAQPRPQEITQEVQKIRESYDAFKAKGLKLNLARGKPSTAQLDLSAELLSLPGTGLHPNSKGCSTSSTTSLLIFPM
jgi:hypothetical protein